MPEFQHVSCRVEWIVTLNHLDGEGRTIQKRETLGGPYNSKTAAHAALLRAGFIPPHKDKYRNHVGWEKEFHTFTFATVARILIEII